MRDVDAIHERGIEQEVAAVRYESLVVDAH
jgi:hypothetical protein